jgi:hypothetical protein
MSGNTFREPVPQNSANAVANPRNKPFRDKLIKNWAKISIFLFLSIRTNNLKTLPPANLILSRIDIPVHNFSSPARRCSTKRTRGKMHLDCTVRTNCVTRSSRDSHHRADRASQTQLLLKRLVTLKPLLCYVSWKRIERGISRRSANETKIPAPMLQK